MRAVVQRVSRAEVITGGATVASIGAGLLVLAGLHEADTHSDLDFVINKILGVRIFNDSGGIMNLSVSDIRGEVLLVPQFTLYGDVRRGKRPSYSDAMKPDDARLMFDDFVSRFRALHENTGAGIFGADMEVALVNDGPVTIIIDSDHMKGRGA